jgi:hypothetical protein
MAKLPSFDIVTIITNNEESYYAEEPKNIIISTLYYCEPGS